MENEPEEPEPRHPIPNNDWREEPEDEDEPEEERFDEPEENTDYRNTNVIDKCNLYSADEGRFTNSDKNRSDKRGKGEK